MKFEEYPDHVQSLFLERWRLRQIQASRESLYWHVKHTLGNRTVDVPYIDDPGVVQAAHEAGAYIKAWIKHGLLGKRQRTYRKLMYIMPRECMKTSIITQGIPTYAHQFDPNIAMAISSYNDDAVHPMANTVKAYMEGSPEHALLSQLYGPFRSLNSKRKWTEDFAISDLRTSNRKDPTLKVFSVLTGGTSGHYDLVILDDPITKELVGRFGSNWFDKVWDHYVSLGYVVNKPTGLLVVVMTRYGEDDLCGRIIEKEIAPAVRAKTTINVPGAERSSLGQLPSDFYRNWHRDHYAGLAGWKVIYRQAYDEDIYDPSDSSPGGLHFPLIWSRDAIESERRKSDADVYAQLQNTPAKRKANPIKDHHIERAKISPESIPQAAYDWVTIQMDLAWKDDDNYRGDRGDWNVIQYWGHHEGIVYLLWGWHSRTSTQKEFGDAFIRGLQWSRLPSIDGKVRVCTYDKERGGHTGAVADYLGRVCNLQGIRAPRFLPLARPRGKANTARILEVVGYWQDGRVKVPIDIDGAPELLHEMSMIDMSRHDDHASSAADVWNEEVLKPVGMAKTDRNDHRFKALPVAVGHLDEDGGWVYGDNEGSGFQFSVPLRGR